MLPEQEEDPEQMEKALAKEAQQEPCRQGAGFDPAIGRSRKIPCLEEDDSKKIVSQTSCWPSQRKAMNFHGNSAGVVDQSLPFLVFF